ncbi:cobyric acid synthase [Flexithrix dorotheae]|uniref:cobyric acid synthase n=1 Tax=Flexithrix dorotheae TaxID=70993 RepID=UPI00039BB00C|nr:cobyric acid synthase [Flexithrix dorotheae]
MTKILKPIMFVGTGSDVGKSVICAGFCRIFKQDGFSPAPFKAQNMSLNSFPTPEGLEIGRAQAVQAEAAGIPCKVEMNPVLLKPTNDKTSQVVLNGKPIGNQSAMEYFNGNNRQELFNEVTKAFDRLVAQYSPIVMEGAGSISEINLKDRDITNMRMAIHAQAATILIADIDRGGVFGSIYGTILLLDEEERKQIKGIIINKFRGDIALFEDGVKMLEELTGVKVLGVVPYFRDIFIEEEDSVVVDRKLRKAVKNKVNIAIVLLKRMSNFTDFQALEQHPYVNIFYSHDSDEIAQADIIIIPGSKNSIADLVDIKNNGLANAILKARKAGKTIIGICGGYQMMGLSIEDPHGVEGQIEYMPGLGLLPIRTILEKEKTTRQVTFTYGDSPTVCKGYEIHMGETIAEKGISPVVLKQGKIPEGCKIDAKCWGTYLHGILDNHVVIEDILKPFLGKENSHEFDYQSFKEEQYNKLAEVLRNCLDLDYVYKVLKD